MDWKRLEEVFATQAKRAIGKVLRENPRDTFYAVALYESYRELDAQISLPWLATNSVQQLMPPDGEEPVYEFNPADWHWREIELATKELHRLTFALQEEATRSTEAHWYRTEKRFLATMVRVVKQLYAHFKGHQQTTNDFIVYFDDEDGDLDLLRKCLPKALLRKHFGEVDKADVDRRQLVASSESKQLAEYLSDIYKYEDEIAALGEPALDALVGKLQRGEDGHTAARLLGRIGVANDKVIRALRREVRRSTDFSSWSAGALGMLGDDKYVLKLADDDTTREYAVKGIAMPLRSWVNEMVSPIPLSYVPLEQLLGKGCSKCERILRKELAPGVSFREIAVSDIDEALRGLQSRYLVIRQHAVCVLGDRKLGKAAAKRVLPAILECFRDRSANVRRLAILNLSYWKAAAKPYRPDVRRMLKDRDPNVRAYARSALDDI